MLLYHSTFAPPYVHYSVIPASAMQYDEKATVRSTGLLNAPVAGVHSAKMMHDFGVSSNHTIIMDLPLSLDPLNLAKNKPVVAYDPTSTSRFGVFPRYEPNNVQWFETNPCCIFHTANSWDTGPDTSATKENYRSLNMLACRLTSAALVFSAGDLAAPIPTGPIPRHQQEEEQCRLYYYQFKLPEAMTRQATSTGRENTIVHQWALATIAFEFPSVRQSVSMAAAKFIYGCSVSGISFGAALGRAVKIDSLVKIDAESLIDRGKRNPPTQITGCVDTRCMKDILASKDDADPIKVFKLPPGYYAQEPRFVPRDNGDHEDDGWLLSYVFNESQLDDDGECEPGARSELWVVDAKNMTDLVAKVYLPQRVPYGLHGNWFSEEDVKAQRPIKALRSLPAVYNKNQPPSSGMRMWMAARGVVEDYLG